jgi:capsular exopolysaccharide synthesis family protein
MDTPTSSLTILWRGRYIIFACFLVTVFAAYVATRMSPKVYEASAIIEVQSDTTRADGRELGVQQASQSLATTYATLVDTHSFLARIQPKVRRGTYSTDALAQNVSGRALQDGEELTNLIALSASAPTAEEAQSLSNEVASVFVSTVRGDTSRRAANQQRQLEDRISGLTSEIDELQAAGGETEELASLRSARDALNDQLATLIASGVSRDGSISVVAPADLPTTPIKPRLMLNVVVAGLLGLMFGFGVAWLRTSLDRHVDSSAEVEELVGLPAIGSIPLLRGRAHDENAAAESYQVLNTNLGFLAVQSSFQVLTISSAEAGEGKSSVTEGLGRAAVRAGQRVLIVDGDIRTAGLSERLGHDHEAGLTNVIASLPENAERAPTKLRAAAYRWESLVHELGGGLSLLPAGPTPPNPASLLASRRLKQIIAELRNHYDLILFDSPPLAHLADASLLASSSDASILVARAGKTHRNDLKLAVGSLTRSHVPCLGVVVLEMRPVDNVYPVAEQERRLRQWRTKAS